MWQCSESMPEQCTIQANENQVAMWCGRVEAVHVKPEQQSVEPKLD
jgi:hypothetical protein